ncbi:hypothetical protein MHJ97_04180 [Macrococcus epidermidis]|uniref:hypothetical protein n=1 Tax=Macrococcus epidermidis TaxID=1902580 RepID=UPI001EF27D3B|nr:hypothetical protein [Macrococcus epidermidis]MCG7419630.1 hypothetical protein [Macrococcus epidermidis]
MKKLLMTVFSTSILLTACGEAEKKTDSNIKINDSNEKETNKDASKTVEDKSSKKDSTTQKKNTVTKSTEKKKQDNTDKVNALNKQKNSEFAFMNEKGQIDILSPAFKQYYFSGNRSSEFAGMRIGMTKEEVEQKFGKPTGKGLAGQYLTEFRYGDIGVEYGDNRVKRFFINPSQKVSVSQLMSAYGNPTVNMYEEMKDSSDPIPGAMPELIYDGNANNGYAVVVLLNSSDQNVGMIETVSKDISKLINVGNNISRDEGTTNSGDEITKADLREFMKAYGQPDPVKKGGTDIRTIEDQGDAWLIHTYNLSMAGLAYDYLVDKKTGDITQINPLLNKRHDMGSIYEYIDK